MLINGLQELVWFTIANRCYLTIEDAKSQIPKMAEKYLENNYNYNINLSPQIKESIIFYLKNKRCFLLDD